jgi:DNA polymerase-3 subunit delta
MTIVLTGNNWFGIKAHLSQLTTSFIGQYGELALEKLDASETGYNVLLGSIESLPFLAVKKMIIVYDLSSNKEAAERLETLVERAGDTTDLVIVESKLDKRSVYYKQLKKLIEFHEYNELDEAQLVSWLVQEAKHQGAKLSLANARFLVERVGENQTKLASELQKLIQYDLNINRDNINNLADESPSSTIFNLLDKAFAGDLEQALKLYEEQRLQNVEPQAIHALLVWQAHAVAICSLAPANASSQQIASDSKLSPYVIQKSRTIAERIGRAGVNELMDLLRDIDHKSKTQTFDYDEAMRFVIVSLAKT